MRTLRSEFSLRSEHDAHMALQAGAASVSRTLVRHQCQRAAASGKATLGFAPIVALSLASIIGTLLAL